eukprot:c28234_g1_i3 orf=800-2092(-)
MQLGTVAAAGWQGEVGVGVDGVQYGESASSGQGGYGEQAYGTVFSYEGGDYGMAGVKDGPSSTGSEPPSKKLRGMPGESLGTDDYRGEIAGGGYETGFGYSGGGPPEAGYGRSALGTKFSDTSAPTGPPGVSGVESYGIPGTQSYGISGSQSFVASDVQSFGSYGGLGPQSYSSAYEHQQYPAYDSTTAAAAIPNYGAQQMPQSFQQIPQETGPVGSVSGPVAGRGRGLINLLYKTKLCTNFKRGMCTFNENCCFAHGIEDLRKRPAGWEQMIGFVGGAASSGRGAGSNFSSTEGGQKLATRARLCKYFAEGNCPYGMRCNFLHGSQKYGGFPDGGPSDIVPASVGYGTEQGDQIHSRDLQSQQQHNALFFRGGSAYDYAGQRQEANASYAQDGNENKFQAVSMNEVGYAQRGCSNNISHSGQQADYTRY